MFQFRAKCMPGREEKYLEFTGSCRRGRWFVSLLWDQCAWDTNQPQTVKEKNEQKETVNKNGQKKEHKQLKNDLKT